jgi:hypothetical protein
MLHFGLGANDLRLSTNLLAHAISNLLPNSIPKHFGPILSLFTRHLGPIFG